MSPAAARDAKGDRRARRDRIDARHRSATNDVRAPAQVLDAIEDLLLGLRHVRDSHVLERRFCRDAAAVCDFTRVMLSRVEGDAWRPWKVSFAVNPAFDRHFATHLRGVRIAFDQSPAEDHAQRDLQPVIFDPDTDGDPPLPLAGLTSSYVVVPLVCSTGVFGLVHADHHPGARHADDGDREALWLLADGFSRIYERAVLGERLRAQQLRLRRALSDLDAGTGSVINAELGLDRVMLTREAGAADARLQPGLLTARETDVAELIAKGYGNAAIARELLIVEGTVKTHVKSVMRKLGAANRAEAVAIILGHRTRA